MTTYKVNFSQSNTYQVKIKPKRRIKANVQSGIIVARTLEDLLDVDVSHVNDKYVIMYNSSTGKYTAVNPDDVLSAAATEPIQPGLPADFINELDVDLDNKINLDAGIW